MSPLSSSQQSLIAEFVPHFNYYCLNTEMISQLHITGKMKNLFGNNVVDILTDNSNLALYHVKISDCGAFLEAEAALVRRLERDYTVRFEDHLIEITRPSCISVAMALHTPDYPGHLQRWPVSFLEYSTGWV